MLQQIQTKPPAPQNGRSAVENSLIECHDRIRHFTSLASRICDDQNAPATQVQDAASSLVRYFQVALPLHSQDEDISLLPRMNALGDQQLTDALHAMFEQHEELDRLLAYLLPMWSEVAADSAKLAKHATAMKRAAGTLQYLFDKHLELEEKIIFPQIAKLSESEQASIAAEIRARREPSSC